MIGGLVRLGVAGGIAGFVIDRWLASRPSTAGAGPAEIVSEQDVAASPDEVWEILADIEAQPAWMNDLKSVRLLTGSPIGVGTRAIGTIRILGISVEDPIVITSFDRPSRYAIEHQGRYVGTGVIELVATGAGTHVRWTEVLIPPILPHLLAILQRPIFGAVFQADLDRLRDLVEAASSVASRDERPTGQSRLPTGQP